MESHVGTTPPQTDAMGGTAPESMKDKATHRAQGLVERAQTQATEKIRGAKSDAAQTLTSLANSLHQSGSQLKGEQQAMAGDYLERAADGIEKVASYLQNTDAGEVVDSLERFARRRPELFIGGAFAVGLIAARFLKSSSSRTQQALIPAQAASSLSDREVPTSVSYEGAAAPVGDRASGSQP
jgi:hypothetical protein